MPSCIRVSLLSFAKDHPRTAKMPPCGRTGSAQREGTSPYPLTDILYPTGRYGITLARVERPYPHSVRWCVRKSRVTDDPLGFKPGRAPILQVITKSPTPVLLKQCTRHRHKTGQRPRRRSLSPDPRSGCLELTAAKISQNTFSCRFSPHTPRNYHNNPNTCIASSAYHLA
jgi:hypothetical protein